MARRVSHEELEARRAASARSSHQPDRKTAGELGESSRASVSPYNTLANKKRFAESKTYIDMLTVQFSVPREISRVTENYDPKKRFVDWLLDLKSVNRAKFAHEIAGPSKAHFQVTDPPSPKDDQIWRAKFNPSKLLHGPNYTTGTTLEDLDDAVVKFAEELLRLELAPLRPPLMVKRLDLAFDFDLGRADSGEIIRALGEAHRDQRTKHTMDHGRGSAQTLYIGPGIKKMNSRGKWKIRVYDRSAIDHPYQRTGPLRFEVQLEPEALKKYGILSLDDVHRVDLSQIMDDYFKRAGLDLPIVAGSQLFSRIQNHVHTLESDPQQRAALIGNLLGYVEMRRRGSGDSGYTLYLRKKYEKILKDSGASAINPDSKMSGYLDPTTARFVDTSRRRRWLVRRRPVDQNPSSTPTPTIIYAS